MNFNWTDYQKLAEELGVQTSDEAKLRSAISRAYYSCYCTARNILLARNVSVPSSGEAHKVVWKFFKNGNNPYMQKIGLDGDRLRASRRRADYDDFVKNIRLETQKVLLQSKSTLTALKKLKP